MSDPKSPVGEPVDEPTRPDDVVGGVDDSLAAADAAGRDAVSSPSDAEPVDAEPMSAEPEPMSAEPEPEPMSAAPEPVGAEPEAEPMGAEPEPRHDDKAAQADEWNSAWTDAGGEAPPAAASPQPVAERVPDAVADEPPVAVDESSDAATRAYDASDETPGPYVAPSEPVVAGSAVAATTVAPQPIFVQAPEAPTPKGNRAAAGAIGLLAALAFAVLYLATWLMVGAFEGDVTVANVASAALAALATWSFWVPVVVFFVGFWVLGAIINRGRWGAWVVFGLLVGFVAWGGHILGQLFQAPFWMITASEGAELVAEQTFAPLAIAAFIFGRELTIWFGAWVASRGARVTELNLEAQREYERTIEAGPQLVRQ
jgi:hypothetical protein